MNDESFQWEIKAKCSGVDATSHRVKLFTLHNGARETYGSQRQYVVERDDTVNCGRSMWISGEVEDQVWKIKVCEKKSEIDS